MEKGSKRIKYFKYFPGFINGMSLFDSIKSFVSKLVDNPIKVGIVAFLVWRILKGNTQIEKLRSLEGMKKKVKEFNESISILGKKNGKQLVYDDKRNQWAVFDGNSISWFKIERNARRSFEGAGRKTGLSEGAMVKTKLMKIKEGLKKENIDWNDFKHRLVKHGIDPDRADEIMDKIADSTIDAMETTDSVWRLYLDNEKSYNKESIKISKIKTFRESMYRGMSLEQLRDLIMKLNPDLTLADVNKMNETDCFAMLKDMSREKGFSERIEAVKNTLKKTLLIVTVDEENAVAFEDILEKSRIKFDSKINVSRTSMYYFTNSNVDTIQKKVAKVAGGFVRSYELQNPMKESIKKEAGEITDEQIIKTIDKVLDRQTDKVRLTDVNREVGKELGDNSMKIWQRISNLLRTRIKQRGQEISPMESTYSMLESMKSFLSETAPATRNFGGVPYKLVGEFADNKSAMKVAEDKAKEGKKWEIVQAGAKWAVYVTESVKKEGLGLSVEATWNQLSSEEKRKALAEAGVTEIVKEFSWEELKKTVSPTRFQLLTKLLTKKSNEEKLSKIKESFKEANELIKTQGLIKNAIYQVEKAVKDAAKKLKLDNVTTQVNPWNNGYEIKTRVPYQSLDKFKSDEEATKISNAFNSSIFIQPGSFFEDDLEKGEAEIEYAYGKEYPRKDVKDIKEVPATIKAIQEEIINFFKGL